VQPYDDAGTPPPDDPTADLKPPVAQDDAVPPTAAAPNRRSHARVIGLILAAVLVAAGAVFVWGDDAERGARVSKPGPTGQQTSNAVIARSAGIGRLLERRATAVRGHDKAAFLALIDPTAEQFRAEQGALFDRLAKVPLSGWSYQLAGDGPALPKDRSVLLPKGSTIARVRLDYQLAGSDSQVEREQYLTVVPRGGQWLLAGNDDATASGLKTESDIWDLGPVRVVHGKESLVLGDAPKKELQSLAAEADRGVHDVGVVWRRSWSHHPVIVFPRSQSDMAALIGSDGKGLSQIAAVTTGSFESGLSPGDRVGVNPSARRTLGSLGRDVLTGEVRRLLDEFRPDVVITFGADGAYGHPDHVAIGEAVTEVCVAAGGVRLFHSHFPRSRMLMLDRLAAWLVELSERFKGSVDFVHALSIFAQETTTLGYASDYVDVSWFPAGSYIIEQGEKATSLYLIISGQAEVIEETADGQRRVLARRGPGGRNIAKIAAAHRMLDIVYYNLRDGTSRVLQDTHDTKDAA